MNSLLAFFTKYKVQINIVFLIFWIYILYSNYTSENYNWKKIIIPIVLIALTIFNIFTAKKSK